MRMDADTALFISGQVAVLSPSLRAFLASSSPAVPHAYNLGERCRAGLNGRTGRQIMGAFGTGNAKRVDAWRWSRRHAARAHGAHRAYATPGALQDERWWKGL